MDNAHNVGERKTRIIPKEVIEMLSEIPDGTKSPQKIEKEKNRRRGLVWYKRWMEQANHYEELGFEPETIVSILRHTEGFINEIRGYNYDWIAYSSLQSLKLVVEDKGWEWPDN